MTSFEYWNHIRNADGQDGEGEDGDGRMLEMGWKEIDDWDFDFDFLF